MERAVEPGTFAVLREIERVGAHLELRHDVLTICASDTKPVPAEIVAKARRHKRALKKIIDRRYAAWGFPIW